MRLFQVTAGGSSGFCGQDFVGKDGVVVPKGSSILAQEILHHQHLKILDCSDEFCPDRWNDPTEDMKIAFAPFFGLGNCLGHGLAVSELHCVISKLNGNYLFKLVKELQ